MKNDEVRIWKEAIVLYLETLFRNSLEETMKDHTTVMIADNMPNIREGFLSNISFTDTINFRCFNYLDKTLCVLKPREIVTIL